MLPLHGSGQRLGEPAATVFPGASACAAYGWLGVEIFFVVSGFVICMSAWGRGVGEFAASRISRLFPAYWAAVLFTAGVLFAWPEVRGVKAFSDVVVNLSMLQGASRCRTSTTRTGPSSSS